MNKKIAIGAIILIIILAIGAGVWKWGKNGKHDEKNISEQQINKNSQNNNEVDTSDWKTYRNEEVGFKMKYPKNLIFIFQNKFDSRGNANILFYNNKFSDVAKDSNPLLNIIKKGVGYLTLDVNGNDFIKDPNFDIKSYLTPGLHEPDGKVFVTEKIVSWMDVESADGETTIHFYIKEAEDIQKRQVKGAVWFSNGKLFVLEVKGDAQDQVGKLYKEMAITFFQEIN